MAEWIGDGKAGGNDLGVGAEEFVSAGRVGQHVVGETESRVGKVDRRIGADGQRDGDGIDGSFIAQVSLERTLASDSNGV